MKVKICGITSIEAAQTAEKAGADFIGFVFAPSSREITAENARKIAQTTSSTLKKVGVFVNKSAEDIETIVQKVGLDYVQLHGDEHPETAQALDVPVIKAFSIHQVNAEAIQSYPCTYYLIDSPGETYRGGSGKTFDWTALEQVGIDKRKCILAGGLNETNIQQAIHIAEPMGVDVSSGVETDGKKDSRKIQQFITVAKQAANEIYQIKSEVEND